MTIMTSRKPGERPAHVKPPAYLSKDTPVPAPAREARELDDPLDPTRYGDWEKNGIAIDF